MAVIRESAGAKRGAEEASTMIGFYPIYPANAQGGFLPDHIQRKAFARAWRFLTIT